MRTIHLLVKTSVTVSLVLLLAGCGQRGPLYLPDKSQPAPPKQEKPVDDDEHTNPADDGNA